MRRMDREVTDFSRMLEILQTCDCCRLGLVDGDEAYIVPMNFGIAQENGELILYFHTATEGRKIDLLKKQSAVIMGRGIARLLTDPEDKIRGFRAIMSHYTKKTDWSFDAPCLDRVYVIKLTVTDWSCKVH